MAQLMLTLLACSHGYSAQVTAMIFIERDIDGLQGATACPLADGIENLPEMPSESAEGLIF
nr:hypothetical protein [Pantoea varia]